MKLLILLCLISFSAYSQRPELIDLKVTITNINDIKGNMIIKLLNNTDSFPMKGKPYRVYSEKVTTNIVSVVLKDLRKGEYAIQLYHDENSDDECNMNFFRNINRIFWILKKF